jgi:hypothetical protein
MDAAWQPRSVRTASLIGSVYPCADLSSTICLDLPM